MPMIYMANGYRICRPDLRSGFSLNAVMALSDVSRVRHTADNYPQETSVKILKNNSLLRIRRIELASAAIFVPYEPIPGAGD
jgi:hypothetical protein